MTAGHFGFAAIVKSSATRVPLWALMLGTYLLDVIFIFLAGAGIESFTPIDPAHPAYGGNIIQAYYTHSLVGAALIAVVAGGLAGWAWGRRSGVVVGAVVFSHWLLDLVVHRPDMPILPGAVGGLLLLGLGLWRLPVVSALVELVLVLAGTYYYYKSAWRVTSGKGNEQRSRAVVAASVMGLLMILLLAADVFTLPLLIPVVLMLLLIVLCGWLDARVNWAPSSP